MTQAGTSRRQALLAHPLTLAVAGAALVSLVLFASLPGWPRIFAVLNDAAHGPVFGALALLALTTLRRSHVIPDAWKYSVAFSATILIGIAVEWIQGHIGRDPSWRDVRTDALGAACVLAASGAWSARHRGTYAARYLLLAALSTSIVTALIILWPIAEAADAYTRRARLFPALAAFEQRSDQYFLETSSRQIVFVELPGPWQRPGDSRSLRVDLSGSKWPGVTLTEPQADWRGFTLLNLDVTNPGAAPVGITLRVHDIRHNQRYEDRFNRSFVLQPASREVLHISLADVEAAPDGRNLDLSKVAGVVIFACDDKATEGRALYLTRIWLD